MTGVEGHIAWFHYRICSRKSFILLLLLLLLMRSTHGVLAGTADDLCRQLSFCSSIGEPSSRTKYLMVR